MANQFVKALTMMTLLVVMSLATAVASANGQTTTRSLANVPFDFVVGDSELAAGRYRIENATTAGDGLRISGPEKSVFRLVASMHQVKAADRSKLIFHRYGNHYFLAEIWVAGERDGRRVLKSRSERAIEREMSASAQQGVQMFERVEIALAKN
jgi:hypothetical protein